MMTARWNRTEKSFEVAGHLEALEKRFKRSWERWHRIQQFERGVRRLGVDGGRPCFTL